jgi:hypothetical protein
MPTLRQRILKSPRLGLLPQKEDSRDLTVGLFWAGAYTPQHAELRLKPVTVKDQYCNTCGWNSSTGMKEIDEGEELDERGAVMFGRELGYISGDGFSTLRNNQKVIQKCGIPPAGLLSKSRSSWDDYSDPKHLTARIREEAAKRRSKSYVSVTSIDDVYRALDNGRPVQIGIDWYTGWNASSGFQLPWIVHKIIGWLVGGHALYIYGYDQNYRGQKVFVVRNSFGRDYGDGGDFYITEGMLAPNIGKYGAFINYDLDVDILRWLEIHQGNVVKGDQKPEVYLIQGDRKRHYPDAPTLYAHGKLDSDIVIVAQDILDRVQEGTVIDFWDGGNVQQIKLMAQKLKAKDGNLLEALKKYFTELF